MTKPNPRQPTSTIPKQKRSPAPVVDLAVARKLYRRQHAERRLRSVLNDNRAALGRLFASGLIFTQKGSRAGRNLLSAHQALLKMVDLFARLGEGESESIEDARLGARAEEAFADLDSMLARTAQLTARTGEFLAGRGRE